MKRLRGSSRDIKPGDLVLPVKDDLTRFANGTMGVSTVIRGSGLKIGDISLVLATDPRVKHNMALVVSAGVLGWIPMNWLIAMPVQAEGRPQ